MLDVVTPAEMRRIDDNAAEPVEELIARAGHAVARSARAMLGGVYGRRVTAIAGPGNNGADARIAAQVLSRWGAKTTVVAPDSTEVRLTDLVIDGAYGTGMNRSYQPPRVPAEVPVLAVDIPSGVDGLTGERIGDPLQATRTVTFAALKPGLLLHPGAALAGEVEVVDIGLDTSCATTWLLTEADARRLLPMHEPTDHKWKRAVWVIGGSPGMTGAPLLASKAALRSGSGMVWCGLPGQAAPSRASEIVFHGLPDTDWHQSVLTRSERFGGFVVGCGLGRSEQAGAALRSFVAETDKPLVLDGDALSLLDDTTMLRPDVVLTPHDGEFKALTGRAPGADRFAEAREVAARRNATVLLKGPLTVVAVPDGRCIAVNAGDVRLATAGTGDVLGGVIGSFLAAGMEPLEAAALGAWMHGTAANTQASFGMIASDVLDGLPAVASRLIGTSTTRGVVRAPD